MLGRKVGVVLHMGASHTQKNTGFGGLLFLSKFLNGKNCDLVSMATAVTRAEETSGDDGIRSHWMSPGRLLVKVTGTSLPARTCTTLIRLRASGRVRERRITRRHGRFFNSSSAPFEVHQG